jgi:GntR family transcriptional regulator
VVDSQADRPVYKQIADVLRSAITTGVLEPGAQLPSEHELVAEHGVSRGTARQAIMLLRNEGLIDVVHRLGSFVREPGPIERLRPDRLSHGWEIGRDPEDPPPDDEPPDPVQRTPYRPPDELTARFHTRQLGKARAPADVAVLLDLRAGAEVLVRRWETMHGDSARAIVASYIPWDVATAAGLMHIESGPAVYVALADSGHRTTRLIEEVHARAPTTGEAEMLNISPSVPVLSVQRVNHLADGRPIEVSVSVMSAERYRLVYELHEDG